jgi:hypothetical protein
MFPDEANAIETKKRSNQNKNKNQMQNRQN